MLLLQETTSYFRAVMPGSADMISRALQTPLSRRYKTAAPSMRLTLESEQPMRILIQEGLQENSKSYGYFQCFNWTILLVSDTVGFLSYTWKAINEQSLKITQI